MILLYADDDQDDAEALRDLVKMINPSIEFIHATNGQEAMQLLNNLILIPDYIFIDINMPIMDGKIFLSELKKDIRFATVPIIIYTTSDRQTDMNELKKLGAYKYFVKPTTLKQALSDMKGILN